MFSLSDLQTSFTALQSQKRHRHVTIQRVERTDD